MSEYSLSFWLVLLIGLHALICDQKSRMTSTWKERCYPILDGGWEPVIV